MSVEKIISNTQEAEALAKAGITSLEQVVLCSPKQLDLSEKRSKELIERAKMYISLESVSKLECSNTRIKIFFKGTINRALRESLLSVLGAHEYNQTIEQNKDTITIIPKISYDSRFAEVVTNAKMFATSLAIHSKKYLTEQGITLPRNTIIDFAKEITFDGFYQQVFHSILGNEVMKKALAASLFSSYSEPVHTLVLGDPGSSKTLAYELIQKNFSNLVAIGSNTTRSGLVCNLSNGDLGALALADKKLVLIDELDKISQDQLAPCAELLSNGRCEIHSARIHKQITAKSIVIAFANPRSKVFGANPMNDIGMDPVLMSRFALVVKTQSLSSREIKKLTTDIFFEREQENETRIKFDEWIKLARTHIPNNLVEEHLFENQAERVKDIVERNIDTPLRRDLRIALYLRRIAFSFARSEFTDLTYALVKKAADLIEESINTWYA